ncbi:MAG TPA: LuxR C-terminal-related transcriptional regulator [Pyrinomonadaceae bacterium]|nr:LuxR C-terminal-related transcriptional regulator [Pyrinomonadaceae bacterium]
MPSKWLLQLVQGTADAAFAVDGSGLITVWNSAAEEMFGLKSDEALSQPCHEIFQGTQESGSFCAPECSIHQALKLNQPVANFDLRLNTKTGKEWCNLTIQIAEDPESGTRHAVHTLRRLDLHRLIEQLGRVITESKATSEFQTAAQLISSSLANAPEVKLTAREKEILQMLAKGKRTPDIADQLYISPATVNNHVQHIMEKLDSHSRLEVVARAREAGIL